MHDEKNTFQDFCLKALILINLAQSKYFRIHLDAFIFILNFLPPQMIGIYQNETKLLQGISSSLVPFLPRSTRGQMATKTGISQPQSHLGVALRATAAFGRPGGAYHLKGWLVG